MSDRIKELRDALNRMGEAESNHRRLLAELYGDLKAAQAQAFAGLFDHLHITAECELFLRVVDKAPFSIAVVQGGKGYQMNGDIEHETGLDFPTMWNRVRDRLAADIHAERTAQRARATSTPAGKRGGA